MQGIDGADQNSTQIIINEKSTKKSLWKLASTSGFFINYGDIDQKGEKLNTSDLIISTKSGKLFLNDKKVTHPTIIITSQSGEILFEDKSYPGSLIITREKKRVTIAYEGVGEPHLTNAPDAQVDKKQEGSTKPIKVARQKANDFTVRVLLEEHNANSPSWVLKSKKGFMVMNPLEPSKKQKVDASELKVNACSEGFIYINNKPMYTLQAYITPIGDTISFNDKEYRGGLWVLADGSSNKLINCLGLEDYVACVLTTESWPGWSLEVNKVLAIACRTYVIAMVQSARTAKRSYHVQNTNKHQTYGGGNGMQLHRQAVEETNGLFLSYESKPITAMFDGCCGGVITKNMHGVDFKKAPYLARSYPCTFCKNFKVYSWQADYDLHDLEKILKKEISALRRLREIKVTKQDKAGIVQQVELKGAGHTYYLSGKKIYSLLNNKVKSFYFTIEKHGRTITLKGKGRGHHLGLCQWGAKEMINQGYDYKSVLEFYYPGTQLMKLI